MSLTYYNYQIHNVANVFAYRAIAWLQGKREANTERVRTPSTRRDDHHEFQVGRLKHERVKVPRGEQLVEWAINVMRLHCAKKSILEVRNSAMIIMMLI